MWNTSVRRRVRFCALSALLLVAACGPLAVGAGVAELFKTDEPDLGEAAATFLVGTPDNLSAATPFASRAQVMDQGAGDKTLVVYVRVDKPNTTLIADLVGPANGPLGGEFGSGTGPDTVVPSELTNRGVERISSNVYRITRTLDEANAPGPVLAQAGDPAPDGVYTFFVRIRGNRGRTTFASHRFTIDTVLPETPTIIDAVSAQPRALSVQWTPVQDKGNEIVTGVNRYRIYFEVGGPEIDGSVPGDPLAGTPDGKLREGQRPSIEDVILQSGFDVLGGSTGAFELTGLYAGRLHNVLVVAVDRAGNESEPSAAVLVRTRSGGNGTLQPGWQATAANAAITHPRVADINEDGVPDLVVVREQKFIDLYFGGSDAPTVPGDRGIANGTLTLAQTLDYETDLKSRDKQENWNFVTGGDREFGRIMDIELADIDLNGTLDIVVLDEGGPADVDGNHLGKYGIRFYQGWNGALASPQDGRGADRFRPVLMDDTGFMDRRDGTPLRVTVGAVDRKRKIDEGDGLATDLIVTFRSVTADPFVFPLDKNFTVMPDDDESGPFSLGVAGAQDVLLIDHDRDGFSDASGLLDISMRTIRGPDLRDRGSEQSVSSAGGTVFGEAAKDLAPYTRAVSDDFNADGLPDIALSLQEGTVSVLLGEGQFVAPEGEGSQDGLIKLGAANLLTIGGAGGPIAVGDFNSDGISDLALASRGAQVLTICFGEGTETRGTGAFRVGTSRAIGFEPTGLALGDLNQDGTVDLIVTGVAPCVDDESCVEGRIQLFLGDGMTGRGDGTFFDVTPKLPGFKAATANADANGSIIVGAAADFDGDGITDILVSATNSPFRIVKGSGINGQGNGSFTFGAANLWRLGEVDQLVAADFDGDGRLDVAGVRVTHVDPDDGTTVNANSFEMQINRGTEFLRSYGILDTVGGPQCRTTFGLPPPIAADLDGDGNLDLVHTRCGSVAALLGPLKELPAPGGDPALGDSQPVLIDNLVKSVTFQISDSIAVGDFNRDGRADIASLDLVARKIVTVLGQADVVEFDIVETPAEDEDGESAWDEGDAMVSEPLTKADLQFFDFKLSVTVPVNGQSGDPEIAVYLVDPAALEDLKNKKGEIPAVIDADDLEDLKLGESCIELSTALDGDASGTERLLNMGFAIGGEDCPIPADFVFVLENSTGAELSLEDTVLSRRTSNPFGEAIVKSLELPNNPNWSFDAEIRSRLIESADFDGDGALDLAVLIPFPSDANGTAGSLVVLKGGRTNGIADGSFDIVPPPPPAIDPPDPAAKTYDFTSEPYLIRSGDCNGDGILDLVVLRANGTDPADLDVFLGIADAAGRATATFQAAQTTRLGIVNVTSFVLGDFNSDGIVDAVVGAARGELPKLLLGRGALHKDEQTE